MHVFENMGKKKKECGPGFLKAHARHRTSRRCLVAWWLLHHLAAAWAASEHSAAMRAHHHASVHSHKLRKRYRLRGKHASVSGVNNHRMHNFVGHVDYYDSVHQKALHHIKVAYDCRSVDLALCRGDCVAECYVKVIA
jgi:hypothetical protein